MTALATILLAATTFAAAYALGQYRARWLARAAALRQATADFQRATAEPPSTRALVADLTERLARAAVEVHLAGGEGRGWLLRDVGHAWDRELRRAIERSDRVAAEWETRQ